MKYLLALLGFMFIIGILNGLTSYSHSCYSQYLDMRKPVHYVFFAHTAGYYSGRALGFPFGEDKHYETMCDDILNHTLKGPRE